jgi:hypothetical protein
MSATTAYTSPLAHPSCLRSAIHQRVPDAKHWRRELCVLPSATIRTDHLLDYAALIPGNNK